MHWKQLYFTAAGIGAGLMLRSVLRRRVGEGFYGKAVLITGAARGLGRSVAREFAAEGCRLALCDHDVVELELVRQELEARGAHVFTVRCDVTNPAQVEGMTEAVLDHYGGIEILVNNAAPSQMSPLRKRGSKTSNRLWRIRSGALFIRRGRYCRTCWSTEPVAS